MSDTTEQMLEYVRAKASRRLRQPLDCDTPLFSSGVIDSLALVDVLLRLEEVSGVKIPAGRLRPDDIDTVRKMIQSVDRLRT